MSVSRSDHPFLCTFPVFLLSLFLSLIVLLPRSLLCFKLDFTVHHKLLKGLTLPFIVNSERLNLTIHHKLIKNNQWEISNLRTTKCIFFIIIFCFYNHWCRPFFGGKVCFPKRLTIRHYPSFPPPVPALYPLEDTAEIRSRRWCDRSQSSFCWRACDRRPMSSTCSGKSARGPCHGSNWNWNNWWKIS